MSDEVKTMPVIGDPPPVPERKCTRCKVLLPLTRFGVWPRTGKPYKMCLDCSAKKKLYSKKYREANREKIAVRGKQYKKANRDKRAVYDKKYRDANREKIAARQKQYMKANRESLAVKQKHYRKANRKKISARQKQYVKANHEKLAAQHKEYQRNRRATDPVFRLTVNLRNRVRGAIANGTKSAATLTLLGCSAEYFRGHIEKQFTEDMTWENYGKGGWHIDHIRPCASFDLTDPEQQRICFSYINCQPMWETENIQKSDAWQARDNFDAVMAELQART